MPKAKPLDRLKLTRDKSPLLESKYTSFDEGLKMAFYDAVAHAHEVPAYAGAEEHQEPDNHSCPICGGELVRFEGCYRCKKCGWSKC